MVLSKAHAETEQAGRGEEARKDDRASADGGGIRADRDGCESGMSQRGQRGAYARPRNL